MPNHPPLLGDEHGNYRIHIIGNSGTGKSTLGAYLSAKLNIPLISLDKIIWKPGWRRAQEAEFKEEVSAAVARETQGWIIDGDYQELGTMIPDSATDIIWLDPPLRCYLPRLLWRTFMRLLRLGPPCAEGCSETWGEVFSSKGVVWWCVTHHAIVRTKNQAWLERMSVETGGKMRRLDDFCGELAKWKDNLEEHRRQM